MTEKKAHVTFWVLHFIMVGVLVSIGSIQEVNSHQNENPLNYEGNMGSGIHTFLVGADPLVPDLPVIQPLATDEEEEELGGEICDPSDTECACVLSFIPEEYRIVAVTLMLMAVIFSFVIYDIIKIRRTYPLKE